ncbi:outer membrane beta-barrel protein [Abditibacterium utsteinense]|nr:outer membrane beta-barrel protein [Abditibacterium utsteinense]
MSKISQSLGLAALICTLIALAPSAAHAQSTGIVPVRVKIGALLPAQSAARDNAGSLVPAAEVDVRIPRILGADFVSLGIQTRSNNGGRLRVVPVTISRTFQPSNPLGRVTGSPYFGVGAGAYFLNGKNSGGESDSKIAPGAFGQAGYQFPNKFFVEAKYQIVAGKVAGLRPNGLVLSLGRSF